MVALNIMNDILHCHIKNARNGWDLQFHFCFTMAFDTCMYGRCLCPVDMEHPHLELRAKMKLSWCPAGGKVKRRCSRNHWVGKSASVLVALWLFKSSFPPASWGLWLYEHCATFGRSLNIYLPYVIDNRATGASDETTWELDGQHLEQTGQQLWTKWTSLMHCLEELGGNLETTLGQ